MSSSNLNLYAGAFLGTVFVMMSVGLLGEAIFHEEEPERAGFAIVAEGGEGAAEETATEDAGIEPIGPLLASADVAAGEKGFKKCAACHTVEEGGANKVGPNLWGLVNRPVASHEGFKYSSAMQDFAAGGTVWDYEHLNAFILKPKDLVPGTAMGFAGLKSAQDRADLVAYMRTMASEPAPLPSADAPAETEAAAEPASMEQPAAEETAAPATEETAAPAATEETAAPAATETPAAEGATAN